MATSQSAERQRPPRDAVLECMRTISNALNGRESYAVIGGAALMATGYARRTTEDVDILVKTGTTLRIKNVLAACPGFSIDPRTRHLNWNVDGDKRWTIPIDVLTPALAYIPETEISSAMNLDNGIRIVRLSSLLNYKISSAYTRSSTEKKITDWTDVEYLIRWHSAKNINLVPGTVPNATVQAFHDCQRWASGTITEEEWLAIGGTVPP
jgi:hypothetical protein